MVMVVKGIMLVVGLRLGLAWIHHPLWVCRMRRDGMRWRIGLIGIGLGGLQVERDMITSMSGACEGTLSSFLFYFISGMLTSLGDMT